MQVLRIQIDRIFLSVASFLIISQLCLGFTDTNVPDFFSSNENLKISAFGNPKEYFISKIAPLFADWKKNKDENIYLKVNEVFRDLDINARLVKNTLQIQGDTFEFLVYINEYKRSFPVRYIPLVTDLAQLIQKEDFRLEIKIFSAWKPLPLDRLFG